MNADKAQRRLHGSSRGCPMRRGANAARPSCRNPRSRSAWIGVGSWQTVAGGDVSPNVFISYRRDDPGPLADLLAHDLKQDLGLDHVFRDTDDLRPGVEFAVEIDRRLAASPVTLALVGRRWAGHDGVDRLADREDWVRREIRTAFANGGAVVPVLVDGAALPDRLPGDLERLHQIQAMRFETARYPACYQELLAAVWYLFVASEDVREVVVLLDDSTAARVALDRVVAALDAEETEGARALSRVAVGLRAVVPGGAARRWPDVIVVVDDDVPEETTLRRLQGIASRRRVDRVLLVGAGALVGIAGAGVVDVDRSSRMVRKAVDDAAAAPTAPSAPVTVTEVVHSVAELESATGIVRGGGLFGGAVSTTTAGLVAAGVAVAVVGLAVALPGGDEPADEAAAVLPTVAEPTAEDAPEVGPLRREDEPPPGVASLLVTPVAGAAPGCTVVLRGTNEQLAPPAGPGTEVDQGEPMVACAEGFFPYDVPVTITGADGVVVAAGPAGHLAGGQVLPPWQPGVGWDPFVVETAALAPGDYLVSAQLPDDVLREVAAAITTATREDVDTSDRGGQRAAALVSLVEAAPPSLVVEPAVADLGDVVTLSVATSDAGGSVVVHLYRWDGLDAADDASEAWTYATSIEVETGPDGAATLAIPTSVDDEAGRYLAVVGADEASPVAFELR